MVKFNLSKQIDKADLNKLFQPKATNAVDQLNKNKNLIYYLSLHHLNYMRIWRNWQTRKTKDLVK